MFILAITPGHGFEEVRWRAILGSGIDALMIREKQMEAGALLGLTRRVQDLAPELELWVNGRLDVAMAAGCGLHVPEDHPDAPPGIVPLSRPIHSEEQFSTRLGCQQLLVAPVCAVPGKGTPWGPERLRRALEALPPGPGRILALGGMSPETAPGIKHRRLSGVALIRALWENPDPALAVERLRRSWEGA